MSYRDIHSHLPPEPGVFRIFSALTPEPVPNNMFFTAGIHPKDAEQFRFEDFTSIWNHPDCIGIGECGLDRRCPVPLPEQLKVFRQQAELAETLGKPLILHCVRCHAEIRQLKKDLNSSVPWIIHGFRGNEKTAFSFLEDGCYLSFGEGLLRDAGNLEPWFHKIPADRIFFETDEAAVDIRAVYAMAASLRGISVDALNEQVRNNVERVFHVR